MNEYTNKHKILLHLQDLRIHKENLEVPYGMCQAGISDKTDIRQGQISRILKRMIKNGLIEEKIKHVTGLEHKRKAYFLTEKGYAKARETKNKLENQQVEIITPKETKEIVMSEVEEYIDSNNPYLTALNMLDDQGIIDLTKSVKKKEEVFIGREEEMEELINRLDKVREGEGQTMFISGEGGVGKTTLAMQFKKHAVKEGFDFLSGRAFFESSEPYLPLKSALLNYMEEENLDEKKEYKGMGSIVSIRGPRNGREVENKDMFDAERQAMFYEITQEVKKIALDTPLVMFLDDLQWADKGTLQLLYFMVDELQDAPVFFLNTYRPELISNGHPLREIQWRMKRNHLYQELKLESLNLQDTRGVINGVISGIDVPDDFVQSIHKITEGNPLFIHEYLDHLVEEEKIDPVKDIYPETLDKEDIPKVINDVVQGRVDILGAETRKVLELCSVIGEDIPFSLLRKIINIDEIDLLDKLDILVGSRLLIEEPDEEMFHFSHSLIHLSIYQGVQELKKERLHKKTAEAILEIYDEDIEQYYSNLAYHFEHGGDLTQAVTYYRKAGKRAKSVYAHEDAIDMYKKSLELSERIPDKEIGELEILEGLGDTYKIVGEYEKALEQFEKAMNETTHIRVKQRLYEKMAGVFTYKGDYEDSLRSAEDGLSLSGGDDKTRCRLLNKKGWVLTLQGDYDRAAKVLTNERDLADKIGDEGEKARASHYLGSLHIYKGDYKIAKKHLHRAIELSKDIGNYSMLGHSYNNLGAIYIKEGELDKALKHYKQSLEIVKEIGDKGRIENTYNNIGVIYRIKGELDKALDYLQRSLKIAEETGSKSIITSLFANIGLIYHDKGDLDKALEYQERSLEMSEDIGDKSGIATSINNIGGIYLEKGDPDKALGYFKESLEISEDLGHKNISINNMCMLAETWLKKEDIKKAEENAKEALRMSVDTNAKIDEGLSHKILGMIYRETGEYDDAVDEFEEGIDIFEGSGKKTESAKTNYEYGLLFKEKGDLEEAEEHLGKALSVFEETGMKLWAERTEEALESLED